MTFEPYTIFNETRLVPLKVYVGGKESNITEWDEDLWVECGEDWYALLSPQLKHKRVRIIEREQWLRGEKLNG